MTNRLAILGASGHGKVLADVAEASGWDEVVFYDDAWPKTVSLKNWNILGNGSELIESLHLFSGVTVAIGNNKIRAVKTLDLLGQGAKLVTLIHPEAVVSRYASIGLGSVVMAGAVISTDSIIGEGVIVNTGALVDHDCVVGDFAHISPGASLAGGVQVGKHAWIGIGAVVRQQVVIGNSAVVGAGAVVVKAVADRVTVAGIPAVPLK